MSKHLMRDSATGHLMIDPTTGHLLLEGALLADCYGIDSYTDGDLTACSECSSSSDDAWDGTCGTKTDYGDYVIYETGSPLSIDGKQLLPRAGVNWNTHIVYYKSTHATYPDETHMEVKCDTGGTPYTIWSGTKSGTPAGTITRSAGCDTTSSLTLAAC